MVWIIVLLAVIVVGLTWLAIQGKMGGMPPLVDDRPGLDLPDGDLTPDDLRGVQFAVTMRGYSMAQVDALIDRLADQMDGRPYQATDELAAWSRQTSKSPVDEANQADTDVMDVEATDAMAQAVPSASGQMGSAGPDAPSATIEADPGSWHPTPPPLPPRRPSIEE